MDRQMSILRLILIWVVILSAAACSAAQGDSQPGHAELEDRITQVENNLSIFTETGPAPFGPKYSIPDRMSSYKVPGVGVVVIDDYKIDWAKSYGVRVASSEDPVRDDTLFNAGSISKMFLAAGALKLVETGSLDLDQNINEVLLSWQIPENEFTAAEKVTLRRLLSHSGGIQDGFTSRSGEDIEALPDYLTSEGEAATVTIQQLLEGAPEMDVDGPTRVVAVPGSIFKYANADYAILELLLQDSTDKPVSAYISDTVLQLLGLKSSTFEAPLPAEMRLRAAWEHYADGTPIEGERLYFPFGSLWISPSDLAEFGIEIMQAYNGRSNRVLSQQMVEEMLSAQIEIEGQPLMNGYGFGFDLLTGEDSLVASHTGGTWGSTAVIWLYPQTGQGAVVMTNSASGSLLRYEILYSIAEAYDWP